MIYFYVIPVLARMHAVVVGTHALEQVEGVCGGPGLYAYRKGLHLPRFYFFLGTSAFYVWLRH